MHIAIKGFSLRENPIDAVNAERVSRETLFVHSKWQQAIDVIDNVPIATTVEPQERIFPMPILITATGGVQGRTQRSPLAFRQ